jgi:polyhydroxyalkanoate synthesis regulator phasin
MDEPGSANGRGLVEQILLAGLGAVAVTAERADRLADELAARGGIERDEARRAIEEVVGRWRGDSVRLTERAGEGLAGFLKELGLVTRDEWDELELRVAQIEHRLRLLEGEPPRPGRGRPPATPRL